MVQRNIENMLGGPGSPRAAHRQQNPSVSQQMMMQTNHSRGGPKPGQSFS